ncbi:squalene synthase HpnC [Acidisphaera sp. S103]|uniref:squalene synthase HpnC n=1 Tax=Acidisphaera sp. S103 TaxID=1747223 RepID=UPI00131E94EC|nr:squalene synthase HpnC [Acidisphaera sp. S103]
MSGAGGLDVENWSGKDRGDENFPVGSVLIARRYRDPIHRFYRFARNADDIADSPVLSPQDKLVRLDVMEDVLLGRREIGSPSALALRASLAETGLSTQHATDLLIAFRQDATKSRYATIDELYNYCHYSAVPVGRYVLDLHGENHECYSPSDALCMSLQILNHMQDCGKDLAELDRCYLPQALLDHFGATVADLKLPAETPALRRVFITLLDRVDRMNHAASELPEIVRNRRLRIETGIIHGLAKRLARRLVHNDPLAGRVKLRKTDAVFSSLAAVFYLV